MYWGDWGLCSTKKLSIKNKLHLYKTVVRPIFSYACPTFTYVGEKRLQPLQTLQNKVLRRILNALWYARTTDIHHQSHTVYQFLRKASRHYFDNAPHHPNPLVIQSINYITYPKPDPPKVSPSSNLPQLPLQNENVMAAAPSPAHSQTDNISPAPSNMAASQRTGVNNRKQKKGREVRRPKDVLNDTTDYITETIERWTRLDTNNDTTIDAHNRTRRRRRGRPPRNTTTLHDDTSLLVADSTLHYTLDRYK